MARPFLGDPNFERTVVLLCRHDDDEGAFGLVVNRPTALTLNDVLPFYEGTPLQLGVGGPVQHNTLHYVHRLADLPESITLDAATGVFWGGDYDVLTAWLQEGRVAPADIRFFVGYSGWSPGQLEGELESETWIVREAAAERLFAVEPDALWRTALREMGGKYRMLANYPIDPSLN